MASQIDNINIKKLPVLWKYIWDIWNTRKTICVLTFLLIIVAGFLEGIGYLLLIPIIEGFFPNDGSQFSSSPQGGIIHGLINEIKTIGSIENVLLVFLAVLFSKAILNYLSASLGTNIRVNFMHAHRKRLHNAVIHSSWTFLSQKRSSLITHALTTQTNIIVNGIETVLRLVATLFTTGVTLLLAIFLSWEITLGVIVLATIIFLPAIYFNRRSFGLSNKTRLETETLFEHMLRYLKSLKAIKSMAAENEVSKLFNSRSQAQKNIFATLEKNYFKATLAHQLISSVFLVGIVYAALTFYPDQKTEIIILIIIFSRLAPRVNAVQAYSNNLAATMPEYQAARRLLESASQTRENIYQGDAPSFEKALSFHNVTYAHSSDASSKQKVLFKNLNVSFPAKTAIAIVGLSGAGKTTLVDLVSGLLNPDEGEIKLDGKILSNRERMRLRQHTHYVTHDPFLFDDSVEANLKIGNQGASTEEIWEALQNANADKFVRELPQGLDTQIGDNGTRLSNGQRQRICLARALLGKPALLIFDEATSAINPKDEVKILANLKAISKKVTLIFISHREDSIKWVDKVINIEELSVSKVQ